MHAGLNQREFNPPTPGASDDAWRHFWLLVLALAGGGQGRCSVRLHPGQPPRERPSAQRQQGKVERPCHEGLGGCPASTLLYSGREPLGG